MRGAADKARKAAQLYLAGEVETVRLAAERVGVSAGSVIAALKKLREGQR